MISNLTIELALSKPPGPIEKSKDLYRIIQSEFIVSEDLIDKTVLESAMMNIDSFIYKLQYVSLTKRKLLRFVELKLLNMIQKNFNKISDSRIYFIPGSYLYFSFTDEQSVNIFSSPHITSPILFNPNDKESTYTLNMFHRNMNLHNCVDTLIYKRLSKTISDQDYKQRLMNRANPAADVYLNKYDISNSLFDYYEKSKYGNDFTSCYADEKSTLSKMFTLSEYEIKRFSFISSEPPSNN